MGVGMSTYSIGRTWLGGALAGVLCAACDPPPPCQPSTTSELMGCTLEWRCVDGLQRVQCEAAEGGSRCACYVDGQPQREGDASVDRGFGSNLTPAQLCAEAEVMRRQRADEGCRWNLDGH